MSDEAPASKSPSLPLTLAGRVDRACDGYEAEWRAGRLPRIEAFLADAPEPERPALLRELLLLEIEFRRAAGERPAPEEYRARFPAHGDLVGSAFAATARAGDPADRPRPAAGADATTERPGDGPAETMAPGVAPATSAGARFRILRLHGRGGLGEVYVARDRELNRDVALKRIRDRFADDPRYRARFLFEAEVTGGLEHPGIVPVYALGRHADGRPYYAMRLIKGDSLKEAIDRFHAAEGPGRDPGERTLELRKLLGRFLDVCDALEYAHSRGVLHRDLKPANIMLGRYGETLVVDWGLAKALDRSGPPAEPAEPPLKPDSGGGLETTEAGAAVGTPAYMSPEQAAGRPDRLGEASDVYGLGATLYHLLTGRPPVAEGHPGDTCRGVIAGEVPRPRAVAPRVAPALEAICLKAMAREPADRYSSPRALADDLEHWLADEPVGVYPERWPRLLGRWARRHRPLVAGTAALLAAAVVALAIGTALVEAARRAEARAHRGAETARRAEAEARRRAEGHLYHALVGEARALRIAHPDGYRRQVWDRLGRALRIATPDRDLGELRREAVACLGDFAGLDPAALAGFPAGITALALDPGAEQVAIGLKDGGVHVRRRADGRPVAVLSGPAAQVCDLAFGPDGRTLLALHTGGTLQICTPDPERGWACSRTIEGGAETAPPLAAPGPRRFVFVLRDGGVLLRDLADGTTIRLETREGDTFLYPGWFGPRADCPYAALPYLRGGPDEVEPYGIAVWDVATGRELRRLTSPIGEGFDLGFSSDLRLMACGCDEGLLVYELPSFRLRSVVRWDTVQAVRFSPDGQHLAAATLSGLVKLWSTSTDREVAALAHAGDGLYHTLAFSDDGRALAVSGEREVRVWDLAGTAERRALAGHSGGVTGVAFSPDGARLASASKDQTVRIWDVATGRLGRTLAGFSHRVEAAAFSPDGRLLATGDRGGRIRLWETRSWAELDAPRGGDMGEALSVAFSPDGSYLAGSGEKGVAIWRLSPGGQAGGGRPRPTFEPPVRLPAPLAVGVAFSPDGGLLAFVHRFRGVHLWDLANSREVSLPSPQLLSGYKNLSFRPGGRELAFVTTRGVAEVWDTAAGAKLFALGGDGAFAGPTSSISPGGRWFAGQATPAGVALWDLGRRELAFVLREERSPVWSHAWSPDERRLALGLADGGLCIWDLREVSSRLEELGLGWR